jgi:large subunit ribosomal protein L22
MSDKDTVVSTAKLRFMRISPRKARLVADLVRGRNVDWALRTLHFTPKRSAPLIGKLIRSAVANASEGDASVDVDALYVRTIHVDGGPTIRRYRPRAQGRATRIRKRTSHITVELAAR